jgi:hypothetical protein
LRCDALRLIAQLRAQRRRLRCKLKQTKAKHMQSAWNRSMNIRQRPASYVS